MQRLPLAHGLAYALTEYGRGREDVVLALGRWGFQSMGDPGEGDIITSDSMTMAFRTAFRADVAARLPGTAYEVHVGDIALGLRTGADGLAIAPPADGATPRSPAGFVPVPGEADLAFATGPGIRSLISGELTPSAALDNGTVRVLSGDPSLLHRFAETFHLPAH